MARVKRNNTTYTRNLYKYFLLDLLKYFSPHKSNDVFYDIVGENYYDELSNYYTNCNFSPDHSSEEEAKLTENKFNSLCTGSLLTNKQLAVCTRTLFAGFVFVKYDKFNNAGKKITSDTLNESRDTDFSRSIENLLIQDITVKNDDYSNMSDITTPFNCILKMNQWLIKYFKLDNVWIEQSYKSFSDDIISVNNYYNNSLNNIYHIQDYIKKKHELLLNSDDRMKQNCLLNYFISLLFFYISTYSKVALEKMAKYVSNESADNQINILCEELIGRTFTEDDAFRISGTIFLQYKYEQIKEALDSFKQFTKSVTDTLSPASYMDIVDEDNVLKSSLSAYFIFDTASPYKVDGYISFQNSNNYTVSEYAMALIRQLSVDNYFLSVLSENIKKHNINNGKNKKYIKPEELLINTINDVCKGSNKTFLLLFDNCHYQSENMEYTFTILRNNSVVKELISANQLKILRVSKGDNNRYKHDNTIYISCEIKDSFDKYINSLIRTKLGTNKPYNEKLISLVHNISDYNYHKIHELCSFILNNPDANENDIKSFSASAPVFNYIQNEMDISDSNSFISFIYAISLNSNFTIRDVSSIMDYIYLWKDIDEYKKHQQLIKLFILLNSLNFNKKEKNEVSPDSLFEFNDESYIKSVFNSTTGLNTDLNMGYTYLSLAIYNMHQSIDMCSDNIAMFDIFNLEENVKNTVGGSLYKIIRENDFKYLKSRISYYRTHYRFETTYRYLELLTQQIKSENSYEYFESVLLYWDLHINEADLEEQEISERLLNKWSKKHKIKLLPPSLYIHYYENRLWYYFHIGNLEKSNEMYKVLEHFIKQSASTSQEPTDELMKTLIHAQYICAQYLYTSKHYAEAFEKCTSMLNTAKSCSTLDFALLYKLAGCSRTKLIALDYNEVNEANIENFIHDIDEVFDLYFNNAKKLYEDNGFGRSQYMGTLNLNHATTYILQLKLLPFEKEALRNKIFEKATAALYSAIEIYNSLSIDTLSNKLDVKLLQAELYLRSRKMTDFDEIIDYINNEIFQNKRWTGNKIASFYDDKLKTLLNDANSAAYAYKH